MRYLKLVRPPRERRRISELASELGVPATEIMGVLDNLGEFVRSASSYVEVPIIRQVHAAFNVEYLSNPSWRKGQSPPTPSQPQGLTPPAKKPRRDNNPLMGTSDRPQDQLTIAHPRGPKQRFFPPEWQSRTTGQEWSLGGGVDSSPAFEFVEWKVRGFSEIDRDAWIAAGLRASQGRLAAELREAGLQPTDLATELYGWKVIDRLTRGEGATGVARMLCRSRRRYAGYQPQGRSIGMHHPPSVGHHPSRRVDQSPELVQTLYEAARVDPPSCNP